MRAGAGAETSPVAPELPRAAEPTSARVPAPAAPAAETTSQREREGPSGAVEVTVASIAAVPERGEREAETAAGDAPSAHGEPPSVASIAEDLAPLLAWWPAVVDLVRGDNAMLGACIQEARPVEVAGEDLVVAFGAPFLKKKAEKPDNRAAVTAALHDVTGRRWRLSYELQDELAADDGGEGAPLSEEEWLQRFIEEFDAEELPGEEAVGSERKEA
jgi:hypothetical protein